MHANCMDVGTQVKALSVLMTRRLPAERSNVHA